MLFFSIIALTFLAKTSFAAPVKCEGNACSIIDIKNIKYYPGGTAIKEVTVVNNGSANLAYKIHWASTLGQCNVRDDGVLSAGQTRVITNTVAMYVAWCKVEANKN